MPLSELPKIFDSETLALVRSALDQAWQELRKDERVLDAEIARQKLATTITALAAVGETDRAKLAGFALRATKAGYDRLPEPRV